MTVRRVIVLAAGEGYQLDGFNKALLRHPGTGETVLEGYRRLFPGLPMTVVVGYRAVAIMQHHPDLDYVINGDWRVTGNSYSLGLALDDRPCYVLSSDFFLDAGVAAALESAAPNAVVAAHRPNRTLSALNLDVRDDGSIASVYQGEIRSDTDPEAPGLFKVSSPGLLREWRRRCLDHGNLFALQNLPLDGEGDDRVAAIEVPAAAIDEVNTPGDYLNLIERTRGQGSDA